MNVTMVLCIVVTHIHGANMLQIVISNKRVKWRKNQSFYFKSSC